MLPWRLPAVPWSQQMLRQTPTSSSSLHRYVCLEFLPASYMTYFLWCSIAPHFDTKRFDMSTRTKFGSIRGFDQVYSWMMHSYNKNRLCFMLPYHLHWNFLQHLHLSLSTAISFAYHEDKLKHTWHAHQLCSYNKFISAEKLLMLSKKLWDVASSVWDLNHCLPALICLKWRSPWHPRQVALSVPARDFHAAARDLIVSLTPFPSNGTVPQALLARRALLRSVMRLGRMRAAEICRDKGNN